MMRKTKGYYIYIAGAVSQQYCALIPLYFLRMIDQRSLFLPWIQLKRSKEQRVSLLLFFILYIKITYEHRRGSYDQRLTSCFDRLIMFICWVPCIRDWGILHLKRLYIDYSVYQYTLNYANEYAAQILLIKFNMIYNSVWD